MEKKISIILVNYNGKEYNEQCIGSLFESTISDRIQIVVVDNASVDGSLEALESRFARDERVHLIALDKNYGFSKANNEGIRWSIKQGIEYFLLLNNDTEVEPYTLENMLNCHLQTKGIVVPKVLYADRRDTIWCAGGDFTPVIRKAVQRGLDRKDDGQFDESGECDFANGCAMFLSKEIADRIGLLDERFFLYYEDTEYSMRALRQDVPIWYCADAVVYHKVNGSTKGNEKPANAYYITRNWLLCNRLHRRDTNRPKWWFALFCIYFICNRAAWLLIWFVQGKRGMCTALLRGVKDFRKEKWGKYEYD